MLKKFFRRKPDGSPATDGSYRSPPGPAPYQPAVPREAGVFSESGHRGVLPGDSDSSHSSESPDHSPPTARRNHPAPQHPQHMHYQQHNQYGTQYGAPQQQQHTTPPQYAGYQNGASQHAHQFSHSSATSYAPPSHQQLQPQQHSQHHRPAGTTQHAMAGPDPDRLAAYAPAHAPHVVEPVRPAREEGEVYYDEIPDLQNPNPLLYTEPAAPKRVPSSQPTVIGNVKPFQPRPQPEAAAAWARADGEAEHARGAVRESLEGLQQQQLVSSLSRAHLDAPAKPMGVPRVLPTTSSSSSTSSNTPRVIQTVQPAAARPAVAAAPAVAPTPASKSSFMPPSIQEVPSTVLCVLGEMEAMSPLVRELQITVLKQELSLGKVPKVMERRRRESWPPRLDMDKIRALERSMQASTASPAGKVVASAVAASPRAQQDEALGVDSSLPIKGRLAQLRQKWEGVGGKIPLPVLTSSMPKVMPKWNRNKPVHFTGEPMPKQDDDDKDVSHKSSLTIQGLSLAVSAHTPTSPQNISFPPAPAAAPAPPEPPAEIPAAQFAFRLPGEAAPETDKDQRPGGGLGTAPLFKPRSVLALLEQPAAPPPPQEEKAFSIPDLQLDALDGEGEGEEEEEGAGKGLVDSVPEGARGSTRDNSLDSDSRAPAAPSPTSAVSTDVRGASEAPAGLAGLMGYSEGRHPSHAPTPGPDTYQPPALAGYSVADSSEAAAAPEGGYAQAGEEAQFGAVPVEVPGLAVEEDEEAAGKEAEESVVLDLASALMSGTLARLNKKIKDFEDGFWVLSCKGSEGHAAGVNIGFAYKLEVFDSKRDAATHAAPTDSMFLQGATVKFVTGTVFKVHTTNELNKKGTINTMSTNTEKEAAEWLAAMELVPDVSVDWVGKDGRELARA